MPWYEHECEECGYEFEDLYSVNAKPPTTCPKCGKESVKRVISLTANPVVELTGQDLKNKIKQDARKIQQTASNNENLYANLVSETKYETLQTKIDSAKKEIGKS